LRILGHEGYRPLACKATRPLRSNAPPVPGLELREAWACRLEDIDERTQTHGVTGDRFRLDVHNLPVARQAAAGVRAGLPCHR
jgi:hypothetical protein